MNLDSTLGQKITGYFDEDDSELYDATIFLDKLRPWLSEVQFNQHTPHLFSGNINSVFKLKNGTEIKLKFPSSRISGEEIFVNYSIQEINYPINSKPYIRTGPVRHLLYFPREFDLLGHKVNMKEVGKNKRIDNKAEYYFEIEEINCDDSLIEEKFQFCLSTMTCTYLWISEKCDSNHLLLTDKISKSSTVPYMGSGNMQFPIKVCELEALCEQIKWDNLYNFHLHYANFVTTNNYIFPVVSGKR